MKFTARTKVNFWAKEASKKRDSISLWVIYFCTRKLSSVIFRSLNTVSRIESANIKVETLLRALATMLITLIVKGKCFRGEEKNKNLENKNQVNRNFLVSYTEEKSLNTKRMELLANSNQVFNF